MPSSIQFERKEYESTFLDPRKGFAPTRAPFEVRLDPLTGRTGHISHFGAVTPPRLPLDAYRTAQVKGFCPFCPENRQKYTPQFPEGVLRERRPGKNEALLIPNLFPYDIYNGVVIMADDHVVPLGDLTSSRLEDAFSTGLDFLRTIASREPSLPYHVMTWNYMPPSGGGLVHPHQQYFASAHPGNQYMDELNASKLFLDSKGLNYWHELGREEERLQSRYIGRAGDSIWITPFVSHGLLGEVLALFPEVYSIDDFTGKDLGALVEGLLRVFRYFMHKGIDSFNASLFFGPSNQGFFSSHFRIVPRTFLNLRDYASDLNFFQALLGEPVSVVVPEEMCPQVREFFL
ncbi:MAG TPA: hypothetical protein VGJ94_01595 [Syntrophorhabdaceae bacterium]